MAGDDKSLEETLEEARRKADELIEQALRRGSELAAKIDEMRSRGTPEERMKAELFLKGKIGVEELEGEAGERGGEQGES